MGDDHHLPSCGLAARLSLFCINHTTKPIHYLSWLEQTEIASPLSKVLWRHHFIKIWSYCNNYWLPKGTLKRCISLLRPKWKGAWHTDLHLTFQVEEGTGLPPGLCYNCSQATITAYTFRESCLESHNHWIRAINNLYYMKQPSEDDKTYYLFYNDGAETTVKDQMQHAANKAEALRRLSTKVDEPEIKHRIKDKMILKCQCRVCGKYFMMPFFLDKHLKGTPDTACLRCGEIVPRKLIGKHLEKKHGTKMYSCDKCYQVFDAESAFKYHYYIYHAKNKETCQVCRSSFMNRRALLAHMYFHNLNHCTSCNASYDNLKCFRYHTRICSQGNKTSDKFRHYICDYCNAKYDKKPSLKTHMIQKHLEVLPYECQTCGKRTSTIGHLKSHEKVHSTNRKIFECYCGAEMRTQLGLKLHQRIHSGEKPYECEECGDRFLSSSRRLDHIKRRHRSSQDMPHACEKCPARFVRPFQLKKHYMAVHLIKVDNITHAKRRIQT